EELEENATSHRRERNHGKFIRTVELSSDVDDEKVEASYVNGRLTVTLPKAESSKPKQIAVKAV
ncbi:MAG: Hsp20/alpha crystallin family protein, partial [Planctomycetota bacterium]|nr:Hsp20/alpha crystallin family protein [Planctomycetota bacterium]